MTLSDLQDDDSSSSFDISNDVFAQARRRFDFFKNNFKCFLSVIFKDFYQRIYPKHHHVVNKNRIQFRRLLQINLMLNREGKFISSLNSTEIFCS